jgi:hypothetical protein
MIPRRAVARQKAAAADPTAAIARPVALSATQCTHATDARPERPAIARPVALSATQCTYAIVVPAAVARLIRR